MHAGICSMQIVDENMYGVPSITRGAGVRSGDSSGHDCCGADSVGSQSVALNPMSYLKNDL